MAGILKV